MGMDVREQFLRSIVVKDVKDSHGTRDATSSVKSLRFRASDLESEYKEKVKISPNSYTKSGNIQNNNKQIQTFDLREKWKLNNKK